MRLYSSMTDISSTTLLIPKRQKFGKASLFSEFMNKEWSLVKYWPSDLNKSCTIETHLSTSSSFGCRRFLLINSW